MESDPIGLEGGLDTFLYASADPLLFVDDLGLDDWARDPGMRWKLKGSHVPHPASVNPNLYLFINCVQRCNKSVLTVTATTNGHTSGSHALGQGIDFTLGDGAAGTNAAMCCALDCGAKFIQDEYHYPSPNATGGHIHAQLVPGLGGARGTGSKPKPKCLSCSTAGATGVSP